MAIIDSIRTMFTADTSDLERGAQKARSIFSELKNTFGRNSPLEQAASLFKGGGAIVGLTAAARELAEIAKRFEESRAAGDSAQTTFLKTLPVVNKLYEAFNKLGDAIYGGSRAMKEFADLQNKVFGQKEAAKELVEQVDALFGRGPSKEDKLREKLEALQDLFRASPGTFAKELREIDRALKMLDFLPAFEFGKELDKAITEAEEMLSKIQKAISDDAIRAEESRLSKLKSFADSLRTPEERFAANVDMLTEAFHEGIVSLDEYIARLAALQDEFVGVDDAIESMIASASRPISARSGSTTAAHLAGSQEAFAASAQSAADKRIEDAIKASKQVAEKQLNELRELRKEFRNRRELVVDIP